MLHKLDFLVRFWELRARHALVGAPLSDSEQLELLSLMQLMTGDLDLPRRGVCLDIAERRREALPVQLSGDGAIVRAELRYACAGGLLAVSAVPMFAGARLIVRVTDAVSGMEFAIPCTVLWCSAAQSDGPHALALAVDGVPSRHHFVSPARLPTTFGMGPRERMVG
jgi:hypothetical protein